MEEIFFFKKSVLLDQQYKKFMEGTEKGWSV